MSIDRAENEEALLDEFKNPQKEATVEEKRVKNIDEFLTLGRYCIWFLFCIELMTLTSLICKVCMIFIGATPNIASCGNVTFIDQTEACERLPILIETTNCEPVLEYQFLSVNVEYNLICKDVHLVKNSISVQMFGVLVGNFVFGQFSDSYGRKLTIFISLICITVSSFINAYATSFEVFYWLRILVGFFSGGLSTAIGVYTMENVPSKHRMWVTTVISWSPNYIFFPIIAYYCHDWRTLLKANALLSFLSMIGICFLFESPVWLIQKGRFKEAKRVFSKIQWIDGHSDDKVGWQELEEALERRQQIAEAQSKKQRKYTYYHILCTWEMVSWTSTLAFGIGAASLVNYALMFNMEKLSGSLYWNNILLGIIRWTMNIFVALWDYHRKSFGRKHINALALLFNAGCLVWICYTYYQEPHSDGGWVLRSCTIAITAMCSQLYSAKCIATNELYATAVRNLATANLSIWSRFGTMIAPQLFQLSDPTSPLPYIVLLIVTLIDLTAFQIFIPETKGKSLEKQLPPKEKRIFYRERKRRQSLVTDDEAITQ